MNSLQISNTFPSTLNPPPPPPTFTKSTKFFIPRSAVSDDKSDTNTDEKETTNTTTNTTTTTTDSDQSFENRLSQVRLKYRSGTGKKAEKRKSKKTGAATGSKKSGTVMLPPVPLKEPTTVNGLKVDLRFTPYSEMLNGRIAMLGLAALVLVELGSGKGLLSYHAPPVLFLQVYTVAMLSALFVKFEKERISIWPEKSPVTVEESTTTAE